jgi:hypothetical protein
MYFSRIVLPVLLFAFVVSSRAQKAWPGDVTAMLSKVPAPGSSISCYAGCTKVTDPSTGMISIKDNGPGFTDIENQLDKILKDAMAGASAQGPGMTGPPSADQVDQMKQEAMAKAAAAQSMTPQQTAQQYRSASGAPAPGELAVMKLIGNAQTAAGRINQLSLELAQKKAKIFPSLDTVRMGPNCPEVQQGGYAGPTCSCMRAKEVDYRTRRTPVMDQYAEQMAALFREYLPKMKAETVIVDDMEAKAKYGDAVSNPTYRQMVVSIQRQAFVAVTTLMSLSGSEWKDAAEEYARLMNARSGASIPCGKK